ncbi:MAG: Serine--tRNA ligase, mitochondrial [Caeruleum heppii]|nr:MAG: Serine--tRNA ligase, mitochondrial [Caeruleum heppii]
MPPVSWTQWLCPVGRRVTATGNIVRGLASKADAAADFDAKHSFAPKPHIDIRSIRESPQKHAENCVDRNFHRQRDAPYHITAKWKALSQLQLESRGVRGRLNTLQAGFKRSATKQASDDADTEPAVDAGALEEARTLKTQIQAIEAKEQRLRNQVNDLAVLLPNLTSPDTPVGSTPVVLSHINEGPASQRAARARAWRSHDDIGRELGLFDWEGSSASSGWGWYFLLDEAAMLEQALVQYALSVARRKGWKMVSPPSIVYSHIAAACGFQPRDQNDEQQIYRLESRNKAIPPLSLAGTAEIPLAAMKAKTTMDESQLPLRVVGSSRCYRAEAGARGLQTKGLYRVHEFTKVEMFAWTMPDSDGHAASSAVFEEMSEIQTEILRSLGLHCRVLEMPSTELGASAWRKRDIEAWFPSRQSIDDGWGEVTSTSMCTDYQTRRLETRLRCRDQTAKLQWPWTVNGTALAVPRVLAAIVENGWDEEQQVVHLPSVLRPWMDGLEVISKK